MVMRRESVLIRQAKRQNLQASNHLIMGEVANSRWQFAHNQELQTERYDPD